MAYLNDAKIVANLAIKPELSISKKGRRYTNFIVRTVYRDESNEIYTDYINVTCFDDDAEILVRDADVGDILLCEAYLAQQHWYVNDAHMSKVVLIARSVQILAKGDGKMPQVTSLDAKRADAVPYNYKEGGSDMIHSYSIPWLKEMGIASESSHVPQPQKEGTWTMPGGRISEAVGQFILGNERVRENMLDPIQPEEDADLKRARQVIPEDLPVVFNKRGQRVVHLPYGKVITEENYLNILKSQSEDFEKMEPGRKNRVLEIAKKKFNIELEMCGLPNHLKSRSPNRAFNTATSEKYATNLMAVSECKNEKTCYNYFGTKKEDWTQNENGEWVLKEQTREDNETDR